MSARHEGAYVGKLYCVIRFYETCGHNKLCPYSWRYADIRVTLLHFYPFTFIPFILSHLLTFSLYPLPCCPEALHVLVPALHEA